jgi:hypothetical protein
MSAQILTFKPRKAEPVNYRAQNEIEVKGLMIRGFGYAVDVKSNSRVYNATLTDFINNQAIDLPLVVQDVETPAKMEMIDLIGSGYATAVRGYLEMTQGESYFVVTEVTETRVPDMVREATLRAYVVMFEEEAAAAQR